MQDDSECPNCKKHFEIGDILVDRVYRMSALGFRTENIHLKCPEGEKKTGQ
jgi:hypothetical protein